MNFAVLLIVQAAGTAIGYFLGSELLELYYKIRGIIRWRNA